jgi:cytochrome c
MSEGRAMIRQCALLLGITFAGAGAAQAAGDPEKGQQMFNRQCRSCHSLEPGKNGIGPTLHGVLGRKAGTVENYSYSPAMRRAAVTWDEATLKQYLADPHKLIPGDKMAFAGIKSESELDELIAFLKQASQ